MSNITPTDAELNECARELANTYKECKKLIEQYKECYRQLRKSVDKAERELIETKIEKIVELCDNADNKYRILYELLNPYGDDDRDGGPLSGDCC
jgi:uncharacterized coiled-coil DUF342 family protein